MARQPRSRAWVFTINNYCQNDENLMTTWMESVKIEKMAYQFEKGEEGTPHIQGFLKFKNARNLTAMKRYHPLAHWEIARGNDKQCYDYCTKEETRISGPWYKGDFNDMQGKRNDLKKITEFVTNTENDIDDEILCEKYPLEFARYMKYFEKLKMVRCTKLAKERVNIKKQVIIYWGPTGTGKTTEVRRICEANKLDLYIVPEGTGSKGSIWFDGYWGQKAVLFDDFYGYLKFHTLLQLLHEHPFQVQVKGGFVDWCPIYVFFTSNQHPKFWYKNVDNTEALQRRITHTIEMKQMRIISGEIGWKDTTVEELQEKKDDEEKDDIETQPTTPEPRKADRVRHWHNTDGEIVDMDGYLLYGDEPDLDFNLDFF